MKEGCGDRIILLAKFHLFSWLDLTPIHELTGSRYGC